MTDAALSAVLDRELKYIGQVRVRRYRPTKFRTIMRVDNSVPAWASHIETQKVTDFASLVRIDENTGVLPQPTLNKEIGRFNMWEFGLAYKVMDRELERANRTGIHVDALKATANQNATEQFLDKTACVGNAAYAMPGLANCADVTATTITGKWLKSDQTSKSILDDMLLIGQGVYVNSKEVYDADTMIMPVEAYNLVARKPYSDTIPDTLLTIFLRQTTNIRRVLPWYHLTTAATNGRVVAFNSQAEEVARFVIARELTDDPARRISRGFEIDQTCVAGGVLIEAPSGITYADGILATS